MKILKIVSISIFLFSMISTTLYGREGLKVEYTKSNITCFGQANGKIELFISGGKLPYKIEWNNGENSTLIENLKKGEYCVKVTDAQNKEIFEKIQIEMPSPLSIIYNSKKETFVDIINGSMNVAIAGGTAWEVNNSPYYFIRLNNKSYIENPLELKDGIYKINIEDANGCKLNVPVNIDFEIEGKNLINSNYSSSNLENEYNGYGNVEITLIKPVTRPLVSINIEEWED